jgi:hypothetical protein
MVIEHNKMAVQEARATLEQSRQMLAECKDLANAVASTNTMLNELQRAADGG